MRFHGIDFDQAERRLVCMEAWREHAAFWDFTILGWIFEGPEATPIYFRFDVPPEPVKKHLEAAQ